LFNTTNVNILKLHRTSGTNHSLYVANSEQSGVKGNENQRIVHWRGATSSSFRRGEAIFMEFHSMTSSWLFKRDTSSQTAKDKFTSQRFRKWEFFSFNQGAGQTIRTE